jgi:hypothetical protein
MLTALNASGLLTPSVSSAGSAGSTKGGIWNDACLAHTQGYYGDYMDNTKFEVPAGSGMTLARSLADWWRSTNATDNATTRDSRGDQGVPSSQHRLSAANYHVDAVQWPNNAPCKSAHGVDQGMAT